MSFWKILKDVGTSSVRIVTDTGIDVGNVVTGFQFSGKMESAKKAMDKVGLKSASTAIRDNHYPEIEVLTSELKLRGQRISMKVEEHTALTAAVSERLLTYHNFADRVSELNALQHVITHLMRVTKGDIPELAEFEIDSKLNLKPASGGGTGFGSTQRTLIYTQLAAGTGATIALTATVMSSSAKVARVASRASAVLFVASVGLDVALSFASYSKQLKQLREMKQKAITDEATLDTELTELETQQTTVDAAIEEILNACDPRQQEQGFLSWADARKAELMDVRGNLERQARNLMEESIGTLVAHGTTAMDVLMKVANAFLPDIPEAEIQAIVDRQRKEA